MFRSDFSTPYFTKSKRRFLIYREGLIVFKESIIIEKYTAFFAHSLRAVYKIVELSINSYELATIFNLVTNTYLVRG